MNEESNPAINNDPAKCWDFPFKEFNETEYYLWAILMGYDFDSNLQGKPWAFDLYEEETSSKSNVEAVPV
jgi:hypothetical protein